GKEKYKKIRSIVPATISNVGNDVVIEENVELGPNMNVLSDGLYIGKRTYIGYCKSIGKYTSISYDVKIGLVAHPLDYISTSPVFYAKRRGWVKENLYDETKVGHTEIGNDVLISANVTILAGVKIGNGAVIGAGSFINKDVPPYAIVAGTPAKLIRYRFSEEVITKLEQLQWWNFSKEKLLRYKEFFADPAAFIKHAD
ncbi:MAG TPA: CatB-related O-acetyltransferase, partial [Bacteroidia bacterium]